MPSPSALFLDRDGTIIHDVDHIRRPEDVRLIDGAKETLQHCVRAGVRLFILTNQSGIGRGYFTEKDFFAVHSRMCERLELPEPGFLAMRFAPEVPGQPSEYRKPSPKFILEMIAEHGLDTSRAWMIGDRQSDWQAGLNAGIRPVALTFGGKDFGEQEADFCRVNKVAVHTTLANFVKATPEIFGV